MSAFFLICASQQELNGMFWLCKYHALDPALSLIRNRFGYSVCCTSSLAIKSKYTTQKYKYSSLSNSWKLVLKTQHQTGMQRLSYLVHVKSSVSPTQQDGPCSTMTCQVATEHRLHLSQGQQASQGKAFGQMLPALHSRHNPFNSFIDQFKALATYGFLVSKVEYSKYLIDRCFWFFQ